MAATGGAVDEPQLSFPLPPTFYYKHYTDENVKNETAPKPPEIVTGEYSLFGHIFKTDDDIIQPLESQGIKRLYSKEDNFDHIVEMKKLNHSILVNYMELVDIMIEAPASDERLKKIEEIKVLFINLHHLINEFRPHQARETLRIMLHRQKQQRIDTTDRLKRNIEKARSILKSCSTTLHNHQSNTTTASNVDSKVGVLDEKPALTEQQQQQQTQQENFNDLKSLQQQIMCDVVDGIS